MPSPPRWGRGICGRHRFPNTGASGAWRCAARRNSFVDQKRLDGEWQRLNYTGRPDYAGAQSQYERLAALFTEQGSEIDYLPAGPGAHHRQHLCARRHHRRPTGADPLQHGQARTARRARLAGNAFRKLGLPVAGRIEGEGMVEGGDMVWFDDRTLAVGHTYRSIV